MASSDMVTPKLAGNARPSIADSAAAVVVKAEEAKSTRGGSSISKGALSVSTARDASTAVCTGIGDDASVALLCMLACTPSSLSRTSDEPGDVVLCTLATLDNP